MSGWLTWGQLLNSLAMMTVVVLFAVLMTAIIVSTIRQIRKKDKE